MIFPFYSPCSTTDYAQCSPNILNLSHICHSFVYIATLKANIKTATYSLENTVTILEEIRPIFSELQGNSSNQSITLAHNQVITSKKELHLRFLSLIRQKLESQ